MKQEQQHNLELWSRARVAIINDSLNQTIISSTKNIDIYSPFFCFSWILRDNKNILIGFKNDNRQNIAISTNATNKTNFASVPHNSFILAINNLSVFSIFLIFYENFHLDWDFSLISPIRWSPYW